jgi:uncharacterized protein YndB with AHSA1/START domain
MPVVSTAQDPEGLSLTIVSELAASPARVWQVWVDPRQLERWWGPPTWPATFEEHQPVVGGRSSYYMTGPEGQKARGWWRFVALDEPRCLEVEDGFSDESGEPNDDMPRIGMRVDLEPSDVGTRMTVTSRCATPEQMQRLLAMGMLEGFTQAAGQLDELLAAG